MGQQVYQLNIGYQHFLFANAADALKIMEGLSKANLLETVSTGGLEAQYVRPPELELKLVTKPEGLYTSYEQAKAALEAAKLEQPREVA